MSHILGVKFRDFGQTYHFDSGPFVVAVGDHVIVETEQGRGLGEVVSVLDSLPEGVGEDLKPIFRLATEEDLTQARENEELAREARHYCRRCINERELEMKLVDVEVFLDRGKMIFYFTAPGRVDFRELVKDLVRSYRTRIELRQIGVRHETQMIGAVGNCGQLCCCRRFLRKFDPVTIKMAKEQNLFLNPTKISGICGRLLCCLNYEQKNYEEFQRRCPKMGKKFPTSLGTVKVLRSNFFRESLTVLTEQNEEKEVTLTEWEDILGKPLVVQEPKVEPRPPRRERPRERRPQAGQAPESREPREPGDAGEDVPPQSETGAAPAAPEQDAADPAPEVLDVQNRKEGAAGAEASDDSGSAGGKGRKSRRPRRRRGGKGRSEGTENKGEPA